MLGARGLPRAEYFAELAPRLRRTIDSDATCWHTLDPHTRLLTSDAPDELIERGIFTPETVAAAGELMVVRSEYLVEDVNTFAELAGRRVAGRHPRPRDARQPGAQRALPRPARSVRHPARAAGAFVVAAASGAPCTSPAARSSGPFTERDADGARARHGRDRQAASAARCASTPRAAATGAEAAGPRRARRRRRGRADHPAGARAAGRDRAATGSARSRARCRRRSWRSRRSHARGAAGAADVVTVPADGGWITLHASLPDGPASGRVAIVIERAVGRAVGDCCGWRSHGATRARARGRDAARAGPDTTGDRGGARRSPRTPSATTSRASSRSSASPRARSSSPASSSTSTCPRCSQRTPLTSHGRFEERRG